MPFRIKSFCKVVLLSYFLVGNLQLLGVPDQAEKDEIVKAVMHLKSSEIDEGYTTDVVVSRQVGTPLIFYLQSLVDSLMYFPLL